MKTHSKEDQDAAALREELLGAGLESTRKSYYPQLQAQLKQLRENQKFLQEKSEALIQEIAARKRAEEEVRNINQELERRVALRTRELEAANAELESFTSMVSHDLRAPLRRISAYTQIVQESCSTALNQESQAFMGRILDGTARMNALIDSLLAFSRAARAEITGSSVDLGILINETQQELESECKNRNVVWQVEQMPTVRADRALLRQVVFNLLSNSLKYTQTRPEARISISARQTDSEHVIFIRDNGVGFAPQLADRLFKPFNRLHADEEFAGTGIGLATVARIIERHAGKVWAEGEPGKGACFYFTLPRKTA